jgi:S1-C subfamily serine protease
MTPPPRSMVLERRALLGLMLAGWAGSAAAQSTLPELVRRAKPAVVLVGTYAETDNPRFGFRGTGFAVGDGLTIVTNAHVLPPPEQAGKQLLVQVWQGGSNWQARRAELLRANRPADLALLRIEGEPLPTLPLAADEPPPEGSEVALLGFPIGGALGFSHVVHRGTLAAITQMVPPQARAQSLNAAAIRQLRQGPMQILQLDAVAYPGNSGGPLFDIASGEVIGVINMVLTKAGREGALSAPTGITYAIPVAQLRALLLPR